MLTVPLQNRVHPKGTLEAVSSRGSFMGNRGVLHNDQQEVTRLFKLKRWIICSLEYNGRKRGLMSPGSYTELFFLDEATAFAAGHRPCAECRRTRYNEFRDAWMTADGVDRGITFNIKDMDSTLHGERVVGGQKVTWSALPASLPHGTMFKVDERVYAVYEGKYLTWGFEGYSAAELDGVLGEVEVLTPRSVVSVFSSGFRPKFHDSASGA